MLGDEPGSRLGSTSSTARDAHHASSAGATACESTPTRSSASSASASSQRVEILKVLYRGATHHHPRRADRRARAAGGRRAVRQPPRARGRGRHDHLHLPQARRGARRWPTPSPSSAPAAPWPRSCRPRSRPPAGRADGRQRAAHARDHASRPSTDEVALAVRGLDVVEGEGGRSWSTTSSLTVHEGEIVGIAGVEGNGQTELIDAIIGIAAARQPARCVLGGTDITAGRHPRAARARARLHPAGPPARRARARRAAVGERGARPPDPARRSPRACWIDRAAPRERTKQIIEEFDVRTPGLDVAALALSGGNQQKLDRRPGDDGRAQGAHRRPPDPRASTSAPRPPSGTTCARPAPPGSPCCSSRPTSRS